MYKLPVLVLLLALFACDSGPKVIEADAAADAEQHNHPVTQTATTGAAPPSTETHKVVAEEALDTERYTYVRVNENGESFWIALPKTAVEIGATYYYQGGLVKKNFASREHNRVFETLYLVSGISQQPPGGAGAGGSAVDQALGNLSGGAPVEPPATIQAAAGAIKIGDLIKNKSKYAGKTIKVTGKVMKVNPMIMGRNWLHLQDGTGNNFDLTVTTQESIPPGHVVTMEGTIALDMDFGAGYRYDIIMENAVVAK
ncbi:MAG: GW dipeptide domain-containing protein [Saprospiraceae bacterium]|nr:SH3-like domain-containing protein [Lewinellaceae bacterium]